MKKDVQAFYNPDPSPLSKNLQIQFNNVRM